MAFIMYLHTKYEIVTCSDMNTEGKKGERQEKKTENMPGQIKLLAHIARMNNDNIFMK